MASELIWIGTICFAIVGVVSCANSDWHKESEAMRAQLEKARETPHLYRESPDGCKVYRFEHDGKWQFYTRCPSGEVSTDTNRRECSMVGKMQQCKTVTTTIQTLPE